MSGGVRLHSGRLARPLIGRQPVFVGRSEGKELAACATARYPELKRSRLREAEWKASPSFFVLGRSRAQQMCRDVSQDCQEFEALLGQVTVSGQLWHGGWRCVS